MTSLSTARARGYAMVCAAYLIMGVVGVLVTWADAPASMLVVLRMGISTAVLAVFFLRRSTWREIRRPGILRLLLVMAVLDSGAILTFFISMRLTSVAIGMFLLFLSPVWVALLAPLMLKQRTERIVWPAFGIAMGGLAFILVPPLIGQELRLSVWGIVAGLFSGVLLAAFMLAVSVLRARGLRAVTLVVAEGALDTVLVLPLAVTQTWVFGDGLTSRDLVAALILGTVCTALPYVLWTEGVGFIPVQHVPILGYLEPMVAPLYAFLLLDEVPSLWTMLGGLLIVAAGTLVVLKGERRAVEETAAAPEI